MCTSWAGRPRGCLLTFSRPPFPMTQFARMMSDWGTTAPLQAMRPASWMQQWEAVKRAVSQTRGGFAAPSGPGYKLTASALPRDQPWNAPGYKRPEDPRQKKKPAIVMPSPLKKLPDDYIPPHKRPDFAQDIADLQEPIAGGAGQQDTEEQMYQSGSHISPSEASHSEGRSETQSVLEMEALEHLVFDHHSETQSKRNE